MLESGSRVGPYEIESLLGMGGMGAVYRARDTRLGRRVALKIVRRDREDATGVAPADRLIAEARAAAALRHPNVVEVYDAGHENGETYVVMELIEGKSLRSYVGEPVPLATRKRWVLQIGAALAAAHRIGLVHRDVKPENVLVDASGAARVLDFGLAKRLSFDTSAPTADEPAPETIEGRVVGTISYMAPEQLAGGKPDPKWDQFAWGVLAYELLTGQHPRLAVPMPGRTAHLTQSPKLPNEIAPEVPFSDAAAVMLAIAPDPSHRHASMDAALAALREPESAPPPREAAAAAPAPARNRAPMLVALALAGSGVLVVAISARSARAPRVATAAVSSASAKNAPTKIASAPSAPPERAIAASASAPPAKVAARDHPDDYGSQCTCNAPTPIGELCPLGSNPHPRACRCQTADGSSLFVDGGDDSVLGRDLTDGMPCRGLLQPGVIGTGTLKYCRIVCDSGTYAGIHRTSCRGMSPYDGTVREGLLYCF